MNQKIILFIIDTFKISGHIAVFYESHGWNISRDDKYCYIARRVSNAEYKNIYSK